ncbi:MAG: PAAR domain-containing protein [Paucimonas sp.]|jgi:uncharacterized Zn-binding protein involved in type VI secretion|nr:PAAR domain-containing protein [Paucimonas sp.]
MAKGNFIRKDDKTTCGGQVIEGDTHINFFGFAHAREGHQVTCGVTGEIYRILGGIARFTTNGRKAAGTLDSISGCPCRARLIPSVLHMTYDFEERSLPSSTALRSNQQESTSRQPTVSTHSHPANAASAAPAIERCSGCFQLVDQWDIPCASHDYALLRNGCSLAGDTLNPEGYSHICYSTNATELNIATSAPAPALE